MSSAVAPTIHTAAIAALETAINRALELAPQGRERLAALGDCVFALHCTAPALDIYLQTGGQDLRLMGVHEGPVTTSVRGTATDFTQLVSAKDPAATLINGNLELHGDSAPLIELQRIVATLDVDWEAALVGRLGDVAGHQLAQSLRATFSWGRQASANLTRQFDEFIHEEARLTPPRLELDDFYDDIRDLGLRIDRLQSRVERLRKKLSKSAT